MEFTVVYAFLAGVVTVLSPCALPLLPVLLSGTAAGGRGRPWGIVTGFVGGFLTFALGFTWLVGTAGLPPNILRWTAGGLLVAFGLVTAVPPFQRAFQRAWAAVAGARTSRPGTFGRRRGGFGSGIAVGLGLGLSWSPCVGPIMASVFTLALTESLDGAAVATALAFSLGTGSVFLALMFGGRGLLNRLPWLTARLEAIQRLFGGLMVAAGLVVLFGIDRDFAAWLLRTFPGWGSGLTDWEGTVVPTAAP